MTKGIYCYIDKQNNNIVYVGLDSKIDKNKRHRDHISPHYYDDQQINRVLQNNPDRYTYRVLIWGVKDYETLKALEITYIRRFNPKFNYTDGGDGMLGVKFSEETCKKISKAQNTTGFYRVSIAKDSHCKTSVIYRYKYPDEDGKRKTISSIDLDKLERRVKARGLRWAILDKEKAEKTKKEWLDNKKILEENKGKNKGKTHSKETRKKISEEQKYKKDSEEIKREASETISQKMKDTGFYLVSTEKCPKCKTSIRYRYTYQDKNGKRKTISSIDLDKLEQRVKARGFPWGIIDEEKAEKTKKEWEDNKKYSINYKKNNVGDNK